MSIFDNILESSANIADKVAKVTGEYIDKGKEKIDELKLENELSKAQKQLGALVYALYKNGESNDELVSQYIEEIAKIEAQLEDVRKEVAEPVQQAEAEVIMQCPSCGATIGADDAFCRICGASTK